jgi:hypothetical protein
MAGLRRAPFNVFRTINTNSQYRRIKSSLPIILYPAVSPLGCERIGFGVALRVSSLVKMDSKRLVQQDLRPPCFPFLIKEGNQKIDFLHTFP